MTKLLYENRQNRTKIKSTLLLDAVKFGSHQVYVVFRRDAKEMPVFLFTFHLLMALLVRWLTLYLEFLLVYLLKWAYVVNFWCWHILSNLFFSQTKLFWLVENFFSKSESTNFRGHPKNPILSMAASDLQISTEVHKFLCKSDSSFNVNYEVSLVAFHLDFSWQSKISTCFCRRDETRRPFEYETKLLSLGVNALFLRTKLLAGEVTLDQWQRWIGPASKGFGE